MTERPRYANQITFGNIVQIGAMLVAGAVSFAVLRAQSETNSAMNHAQDKSLSEIELRVRSLETQQARADERFSNILTYLTRIDGRLERIERGQP